MAIPRASSACFIAVLFVCIAVVFSASTPIKKRSLIELTDGIDNTGLRLEPNKRTFCSSFNGCSGKRDGIMILKPDYDYEPQGLEPIEDVMDSTGRDILAEARLFEALQARSSLLRRQSHLQGFFPRQKRGIKKSEHQLRFHDDAHGMLEVGPIRKRMASGMKMKH